MQFSRQHPGCFFATLCALLACVQGSHSARADDASVRSAFESAYRPYGERLLVFYGDLQFHFTAEQDLGNGQKSVWEAEGKCNREHFRIAGRSKVVKTETGQTLSEADTSTVECRNPGYHFTVKRGAGGEYQIQNLNLREPVGLAHCSISSPYCDYFRGQAFLDMVEDHQINFESLQDCVWDSKTTKRLRASFTSPGPVTESNVRLMATYYFSPADAWACVGQCYETQSSITEQIIRYERKSGQTVPILRSIERRSWKAGAARPAKPQLVTTVTELEHTGPVPDREFTLSAFGLPEPVLPRKQTGMPSYIWIATAAILAALIGIGFGILARRQRAGKPTPNGPSTRREVR